MNFLKTTVASLLLFGSLATASTFEQSGVKEGNNKISVGIYNTIPDEGDASATIYGGIGHFLTDDIELMFDTMISTSNGDTFYYLKPGANYYFLKTPTLTPYVGGNIYYFDSTVDNADSSYGNNYHVGAHKFFSENAALTLEVGMDFFELTDYLQSYSNLYLTYFFD